MKKNTGIVALCSSAAVFLSGCGASTYEPSELHITKEQVDAEAPKYASDVPRLVRRTAQLPALEYSETPETFDVVVHNVSVRDLLYALARDLEIDVDIDSRVSGIVSISAFDQTFENVLERVSKHVPLRYEYVGDAILVIPDEPYVKQYKVDYLNIDRTFDSTASITGIETDGESGGSGEATVTSASSGNFWLVIDEVLTELVEDSYESNSAGIDLIGEDEEVNLAQAENEPEVHNELEPYFIIDRLSGVILVYAPKSVHEQVQAYLDTVQEVALRQVLLEATVVEVVLDNNYNQGINWSVYDDGATEGLFASQGTFLGPVTEEGAFPTGYPGSILGNGGRVRTLGSSDIFFGSALRVGNLDVAVDLLQRFGETKVISSPRVSAMNNQGALMRVVDNEVYFEVESELTDGSDTEAPTVGAQITDTIVPAGFSMSVLPQISGSGRVMLNIRPSLTRITGERTVPVVGQTPVAGSHPTTSVREFESLMTLNDGEIGVLGGFIEDVNRDTRTGLPGAMDVPGVGALFQSNDERTQRSQLVIFIKATVIDNPSIHGDYSDYSNLLPDTNFMRRDTSNALFPPAQKPVD